MTCEDAHEHQTTRAYSLHFGKWPPRADTFMNFFPSICSSFCPSPNPNPGLKFALLGQKSDFSGLKYALVAVFMCPPTMYQVDCSHLYRIYYNVLTLPSPFEFQLSEDCEASYCPWKIPFVFHRTMTLKSRCPSHTSLLLLNSLSRATDIANHVQSLDVWFLGIKRALWIHPWHLGRNQFRRKVGP